LAQLFQCLTPFASGGVYVDFLSADEGDRMCSAYELNYDLIA
jgi:hypothetical protein